MARYFYIGQSTEGSISGYIEANSKSAANKKLTAKGYLIDQVKYSKKFALVIGSEDKGIRRLTRENCDELIKIDMSQKMDSLNASVSTGILLFEIARQNKIN